MTQQFQSPVETQPVAGGDDELSDVVEAVVEGEGAAPVRARRPHVTVWLFRPEQEPVQVELEKVAGLVQHDENFVWIDLSEYAADDLREAAHLLGLHSFGVHAALSPWQQPQIAVYGDHFLVSLTIARLDSDVRRVRAGELDLFVGNNFLLSAHKLPLPFEDKTEMRARQSPDLVRLDSAYMLYIVLDEVLEYYEDLNRDVQVEIEAMEERALRDTSDTFLEEMLRFKRYTFALAALADQHREVFAAFLRPDFRWVCGEEVEIYFRDLQGRLARLLTTLADAKEAVNGAFEIYVSHMSHRTNQVIKVLTMVSTVLLPTTVIIALFGTNVSASLHSLPINTPTGFLVMLLCIVAVSGATLFSFHRQGWI